MRILRNVACALAFLAGGFVAPASAQSNGCTILLTDRWPALQPVQDVLNVALLNACNEHDECYNDCSLVDNLHALAIHRRRCDRAFAGRLLAECAAIGAAVTAIDPTITDQVLEYCVAATGGIYALVTLFGWDRFIEGQCTRCCMISACMDKCGQPTCPPFP